MTEGNPYDWAHACLSHGDLIFRRDGDFERALNDGFFFVDTPPELDVKPGDLFAENFYQPLDGGLNDMFRGFRRWTSPDLGEHQGYICRSVDQVEQFFLESRHWETIYPPNLVEQAQKMRTLGLNILYAVLRRLPIPPELLDEACGRCLSGRGTYNLTFNHFRSNVRARGLNVHKDSGWVTVLRSLEPGLEALVDGSWRSIDPRPSTMIVNFGCAMEILTSHMEISVAAVAHRVREQSSECPSNNDRFSYALFVDSSLDESICPGLFCYEPDHGLILKTRFSEFLDRILHNTYQTNTQGLYSTTSALEGELQHNQTNKMKTR